MPQNKISPFSNFGQESLLAIIESSNDPICALDLQGNYLIYNSAHAILMEALYGYSVYPHMPQRERQPYREDVKLIHTSFERASKGERFLIRAELGNPALRRAWFELTYNPVMEGDKIVGVTIFSRDISLQVKLETDLRAAKESAQADAFAKSAFLSNMSHEIRTPMNAIMGLTELLLNKKLEDSALENLKAIHFSANNLLTIINDILDFSKIEAGKLSFENETFDLYQLLEEMSKSIRISAQAKNLLYEIQMSGNTPRFLRGDAVRLSQILINLLGNSIKFTQNGKIKLSVDVLSETGTGIVLEFKVIDSGIGIPKDQLQRIFQSFTQVQNRQRFKTQGTGLGLSITKRLVEMQDGKISVESEVNKGSVFSFFVPYLKSSQKEMVQASSQEQAMLGQFADLKVLLVEDNKINQLLARQILIGWNATVEIANDGFEAIAKLQRHAFDLVLLDLQMPEIDGFEVTKFIRKALKPPYNQIPIVALTADAYSETRILTQEAGMNDYLTKPYQQKDLFRVVSRFAGKGLIAQGQTPEVTEPATEASMQSLDFVYIHDKFGKDPETLRFILEVFKNEIGEEIGSVRKLLTDGESIKASRLIHKLVSTFSAMGMSDTAFTLSLMERMLKQGDEEAAVLQKLTGVEAHYKTAVLQIDPVLATLPM